jgi:hypothetical protein
MAATMAFRFVFDPKQKNEDKQSRMRIYVLARCEEKGLSESLKVLLERGPLTTFYKLKGIDPTEVPWIEPQAACEIVRREDAVPPLHSCEFNDRIPDYYYTICPFKADPQNDFSEIDRVLDGITEPLMVDVSIEPANVSAELSEFTRYLSQLQRINRVWDSGEYGDSPHDYFGNDHGSFRARRQVLNPIRYTDPQADEILHTLQRFYETLRQPHFLFQIIVFGKTPAVSGLIGSLVAESAFEKGSYRLLTWNKGEKSFENAIRSAREINVSALPVHENIFQGKDPNLYAGLARLGHLATVEELTGVFRLPVASIASPRCIRKNTDPPHEKNSDLVILGFDQENPGVHRGVQRSVLSKHLFMTGVPGSGKTRAAFNLILQLHEHGIPFLVFELAKTEYRTLKTFRNHPDPTARHMAETLEIYTVGDERVSPFRYKPLNPQFGISWDEHIDNLMVCFQAAMPLEGPLPALLREALERVYEIYPNKDNPPMMADLVKATEQVLEEKKYGPETNSDIRAALEVRLGILTHGSIGRVFQCRHSIPSIEHLMSSSVIIELDRLPRDQACLLNLFLLTGIREYLKTHPKKDENPRYAIIIEEAHNMVGRTGKAQASPDVVDPGSFASEFLCRMLAEVRALGVSIVIVDQFPSKIAPEVIKSTTTKLALRQVDKEDREVLGASMLLNESETEELARLSVREAFIYTEGFYKPRRITTTNLDTRFDFSTPVANEDVLPYIRDDAWFQQAAVERTTSELFEVKERTDRFDAERLQLGQELSSLLALQVKLLAEPVSKNRSTQLLRLIRRASGLKQRLWEGYHSFLRNSYRRYLAPETGGEVHDALVLEFRKNLVNRFESIIRPDVTKCSETIDAFIIRCQEEQK